jgi:hypothetical protein
VTPVIRKQRPAPAINPDGGRLDLTADFPIAGDGRVLAVSVMKGSLS